MQVPDGGGDRCPYSRPFPADFAACPAFQRGDIVPLSTHFQPLQPVTTCGNLEPRRHAANGRYYARCRVGTAEARAEWVRAVRADRVAVALGLQARMAEAFRERTVELWALKGEQVRVATDPAQHRRVTEQLAVALRGFLVELDAFFEEHAADLEALGAPHALCMELFRRQCEQWLTMPEAGIPSLPADVVDRFPEPVRLLIDPAAVREPRSSVSVP